MNINNVPLLPAPVQRAKDAARAVKDGVHVVVNQVTDNLLTQLLDLQHFAVTDYNEPFSIFRCAVLTVRLAALVSRKNWLLLAGDGDKRNALSSGFINNASAAARKKQRPSIS